jgi:O-glycosyl hydrolase
MNPRWGLPGVGILLALTLLAKADDVAPVDPNTLLVNNFQGWGTSLCWWANVVGGYANREDYADLAFKGLQLNIVRYNVGGGENPGIHNTMEYRAQMPGFEPGPGVWNWDADKNQRWFLHAALQRGANLVFGFANSPPYWMTFSGSVTGAKHSLNNNLRPESERSFAEYLATVISVLAASDGVKFDFVTPMNEPGGSWWKLGERSEGTFMSHDQQARVIGLLRSELDQRGLAATGIAAPEDNDEQSAINSVNSYDEAARNDISLLVTHTYGANNAAGLRELAKSLNKPLWVSEYGDNDGTGMTMARRIRDDLTRTHASAWVYWQFVDNAAGWGMLRNPENTDGGTGYVILRKYYVMAQFSRFIRPGFQILHVGGYNSLAAYNPTNHVLVLVAVNDGHKVFQTTFDLHAFSAVGAHALAYRTSPSENVAALGEIPVMDKKLALFASARSVTTLVISNVLSTTSVVPLPGGKP